MRIEQQAINLAIHLLDNVTLSTDLTRALQSYCNTAWKFYCGITPLDEFCEALTHAAYALDSLEDRKLAMTLDNLLNLPGQHALELAA